jgi:anti-sigma regulatory factor (Ser/Thr protein kinase)
MGDLPGWRELVRRLARSAGFTPECVDNACVVASELGTNALTHGRHPVIAEVSLCPEGLCISVEDASACTPNLEALLPPASVTGARGIPIVRALAVRVEVRSDPSGKVVLAFIAAR